MKSKFDFLHVDMQFDVPKSVKLLCKMFGVISPISTADTNIIQQYDFVATLTIKVSQQIYAG